VGLSAALLALSREETRRAGEAVDRMLAAQAEAIEWHRMAEESAELALAGALGEMREREEAARVREMTGEEDLSIWDVA
jgi:hypothetical protein